MNRVFTTVLILVLVLNLGLVAFYFLKQSTVKKSAIKIKPSQEQNSFQSTPITIASIHPKIKSISITDTIYLKNKLDALGIWEGKWAIFELKKYVEFDIETIEILITDKEQNFTTISYNNQITYSTGIKLDESLGKLKLYIHINPVVFESNPTPDTLSKSISAQILRRLFSLKNSITSNEDLDYIKDIKPFVLVEIVK